MTDVFERLDPGSRAQLRARPQPGWLGPMLATLIKRPFSDQNWQFEPKLDGVRCLAFRRGEKVRLLSRNKQALNGTFPEIVQALGRQAADDFIVDGEIVAFERGLTSFSRLQGRMGIKDPERARRTGIPVAYFIFDLLYYDGRLTTGLALRERKDLLKSGLTFEPPLRWTGHRLCQGEAYFKEACKKGWEGLIAKRVDSRYTPGRSADWLKLKCVSRQEFVIGGFTDPRGSRAGFGALLVGYYERGQFKYAGLVGTGFDQECLRELRRRLSATERRSPLFQANNVPGRNVHYVAPRLVAEVGFTEWTPDGRLRHPRFLGLRNDKKPREVVREHGKSA